MDRKLPLLLITALSLSVALVGCGSSGNSAPSGLLQITSQSPLPSGRVNTAYTTTFTATGGTPPYSWSASSAPPGLVMSAAGTLAGTPTSPCSPCAIAVAVSDSAHGSANSSFSITIAAPLQITTTSLSNSSAGVAYNATLTASGGFPPYTWSISQGNLPGGLTLNASTGAISGSPTGPGTTNFTAQVADNGTPPTTTTANLSITITPPPARNGAVYTLPYSGAGGAGLQINSDGSLSLLPSSPELALANGWTLTDSPTLPLVFAVVGTNPYASPPFMLESSLVNPDYSLTLYNTSTAFADNCFGTPAVDPTGSNVYVTSCVDNNGDPGIEIYPADGSLQAVGSVSISGGPSTTLSRMTFTPDGAMGFVAVCPTTNAGSILSYARDTNGTLNLSATYNLPANTCAQGIMVSPVGGYLAEWQLSPATVQIFSIGSDGTLTAATQPFTVMQNPDGPTAALYDATWDSSGSYLLAALNFGGTMPGGGVALLSFSGSALSQSADPTGLGSERVIRVGSYFYAEVCLGACGGVQGFEIQNGQLSPLPGGQYPGGYAQDMVAY